MSESYPLCPDLPVEDHLKKGTTDRFLGGKPTAELQCDFNRCDRGDFLLRLELEELRRMVWAIFLEKLFSINVLCLCNTNSLQGGEERLVDTVRTLLISFAIDGEIKFMQCEYIRLPYMSQILLGSQAKKAIRAT